MMRGSVIGYFVFLVLLLWCDNASAQMSGDSKMISPGAVVAGGGHSTASDKAITGTFPIIGGINSTSTKYIITSGIAANTFNLDHAFTVTYAGNLVDTVTPQENIFLKIAYNGKTVSGRFHYRFGGGDSYSQANLIAGTEDTLYYMAPFSFLTARGLEYYFSLTNGSETSTIGTAESPYILVTTLTNSQGPTTPAGSYRIVGVPIEISGSRTIASVFEDDFGQYDNTRWRLAAYLSEADSTIEYTQSSMPRATAGRGFWLITKEAETYGATGLSMRPNRIHNGNEYFEIRLASGWNQISNPLPFDVDWDQILIESGGEIQTGHPDSRLDDIPYWFNGSGYSQVSTIPAWGGVFVYAHQPIRLLFPYRESANKFAPKPLHASDGILSPDHWSVNLRLTTANYIDDGNQIGVRPDAKDANDRYDLAQPPPPPGPGVAQLSFSLPTSDKNYRPMRTDFRGPFEDGNIWNVYISPASDRIIEFEGVENIPEGMIAYFLPEKGQRVLLEKDLVIKLANAVTSATILIGSEKFVSGEISNSLPDQFSLSQNYPNPFNPATNIDFALPHSGLVKLDIFNILGQTVATLVNREMDAGQYSIRWEGSDNGGRPVASGIYFYRLSSGTFSRTIRMVLLK